MIAYLMMSLLLSDERLEEMLAGDRFLDAAVTLREPARKMASPQAVRRYVVLLVEYHAHQIAFRTFFAKNLSAGDDLRELRGTPETIHGDDYTLVERDLEALLLEADEAFPDHEDIAFAKAVYVFNGTCCFIDPKVRMTQREVLETFHRADQRDLRCSSSMWALALNEMAREKPDRERLSRLLTTAHAMMPDRPEIAQAYIDELLVGGRFEDALPHARNLFEAARTADEKIQAVIRVARALIGIGDHDSAISAVRGGLSVDPDNAFLFMLGLESLRALGDVTSYLDHIGAFLATDPDSPGPFRVYQGYLLERGVSELDDRFMARYAEGSDSRPLAAVTREVNLVIWSRMRGEPSAYLTHLQRAESLVTDLDEVPEILVEVLASLRTEAPEPPTPD